AYKHLALDVLAFCVIGLAWVWIRRKAAFARSRPAKPSARSGDRGSTINLDVISNAQLRETMTSYLAAADQADTSSLAAIYDDNFKCVRVADDGGFTTLTSTQMLSFLNQAVQSASRAFTGSGGHAAVQTRETTVHHADATGETAFVLMTRVKDLGNGWEPMF